MESTTILAATQAPVAYGTAQALMLFGAGSSSIVRGNYLRYAYVQALLRECWA